MIGLIPAWQQKVAALSLLGIVAWGAFVFILVPLTEGIERQRNAVANAEHQLTQYQRIASGAEALSEKLSQLGQAEFDTYFYRTGASPTVVTAEVQNTLRNWVVKNGGHVVRAQAKSAVGSGDKYRVPVTITFNGDVGTLQKMLYAIESTQPYLIVDRLSVKHQHGARAGGEYSQNPTLNITLDVSGYGKRGGGNG